MAIAAAEGPEPRVHPALQLVISPPHEHSWRLVLVDFDESGQVRMFECADCADVRYD